jgi:hypothetical protein
VDWLIFAGVVVVLVGLGILAQRMGWIDLSNKQRSSGTHGGVMGIGDEVFHPTRHEAQVELDRQTMLPAPAPLPGDGDLGIEDGKIRIDLTKQGRHRDQEREAD